MEESNGTKKFKKENKTWNLRKYIMIALVTFVTFCCCMLVFFMVYRYNGFAAFYQKIIRTLQPVIIGLVIAYLINPVMVFIEHWVLIGMEKVELFKNTKNSEKKKKKTARTIGTAGALAFLLLVVFLLLEMVIPQLYTSIQNMVVALPDEMTNLVIWVQKYLADDSEMARQLTNLITTATNYLEEFLTTKLLPQAQTYLASITTGVINVVKLLLNVVIGLIISIYVLTSKESFIGQGKKVVYTIFPAKAGNIVVETLRKSNQIFGGFISGKILDSAIIGVFCYICLLLLKMPYPLLIAVIVGVTNIIPFFGPYIGAVPSFILIVLANPIQGVYFLIFILILQQIDGNIIGPKILGDSTGLSPFWVVFAILIGGGMFGIMGMILGVPTFAVIYYILTNVINYVLKRRKLSTSTEDYIMLQSVDARDNSLNYKVPICKSEEDNTPKEESKQK